MNMVSMQSVSLFDTLAIGRVIGIKRKSNNGEYKITIPQNDLSVEVDGFKIIPAMGLRTWIDFASSPGGAMIMGDIVLTENDLKPVQQEVIKQGLTISAIHNHFVSKRDVYAHWWFGKYRSTCIKSKSSFRYNKRSKRQRSVKRKCFIRSCQ